MICELMEVLEEAEAASVQVLALRGRTDVFCPGMDLAGAADGLTADGAPFWDLLRRMRQMSPMVVAVVEGHAAGGGIGLVAAADVVLATPSSSYALPETLWGLLPCCVAPFLSERIGRQATLRMALLTTPFSAEEAARVGLVDLVVPDPDQALRRIALRASRVDLAVQGRLKRYVDRLPDGLDESRTTALVELADVSASPLVTGNLRRYADRGAFPWES
jgi:polyketide biosynthesis enoyl-CoA hydratase PksH